ncbi:MAG TPA: ABC transporter ATP-binding protein [Thermosynergistes sp.]|jgi:branched-chain amino acid transport system ATP-binding protein|nr:ABC transporter ATP-binding protein [Thermosynergistes sp.]HQE22000.1 ABC transporter ATP-binding protein [Thermosynergistes sp.]HXK89849.1 ABC transporter ATP-binding protein [Thermosynergistes sp.]
MLDVKNIRVSYDHIPAIHDVSFRVDKGEIVTIVGSNGAGKTTIIRAIAGILRLDHGEIRFLDEPIEKLPSYERVARGISLVPEGRHIFGKLSVHDNLLLGAHLETSPEEIQRRLEQAYELFPRLRERRGQKAGTLSGGEQQMLAIARGLMANPKLLMLDEPSLGLMPKLVMQVFDVIDQLREERGLTILLVEQNVYNALELSDRAYVIQNGRVVIEGKGEELLESDVVRKAYLGM